MSTSCASIIKACELYFLFPHSKTHPTLKPTEDINLTSDVNVNELEHQYKES